MPEIAYIICLVIMGMCIDTILVISFSVVALALYYCYIYKGNASVDPKFKIKWYLSIVTMVIILLLIDMIAKTPGKCLLTYIRSVSCL